MNLISSPFRNLQYMPLAAYIDRARKFCRDRQNPAIERAKEQDQLMEAVAVLKSRLLEASRGNMEAWDLLCMAPLFVNHGLLKGSVVKIDGKKVRVLLETGKSSLISPMDLVFRKSEMPSVETYL